MRTFRTLPAALACVITGSVAGSPAASADPEASAQLVAMGDSYMAAGSASTQTQGPVGTSCMQSPEDVAHLVSDALPELSFIDNSCEGAVTRDIYTATPMGPQDAVLSPATKVVIVSIGGNDAKFGQIAAGCIIAANCTDERRAMFSADIATAGTLLPPTYAAIRKAAPKAKVFTVGYVPILPEDPSGCIVGLINNQETVDYLNGLQRKLNDEIVTASQNAGFTPVIPTTASDHSVCAPDYQRYVSLTGNGPGDDGIPMHPTAAGRQFVSDLVTQAIRASGVV